MKLYINSLYLLFLFMGFSFLQAETIITTQGIVKGKIIDAQTEFVAVQEDASMPRVIPRVEILRIFDDTQTLVWQNPTIVHEDKTTVKPQEETPWRRNFDIGVKGGLHLLWPNGTLSAMPLGISPGYQLAFDGAAVAAWYFADDAALTAGLGYARRPVALQGILEGGQVHKGVWSIDDGILQLGYRMHAGLFFLEGGLDLAFPLANAALQLTPSATSVKTPYTTPFSLSFYIAVGARIPLYKNIALLASVNIQQAATTAISGNTPTATDVSGNTISYAPLTVLSTNIGVSLGIVRRFDIF